MNHRPVAGIMRKVVARNAGIDRIASDSFDYVTVILCSGKEFFNMQ